MKKYQLVVKGDDGTCEKCKSTSITIEELQDFKPLIKEILSMKKHVKYNWSNETELVRDDTSKKGWKDQLKIYREYPNINTKKIDKFLKYVPQGRLYRIYEIDIYKVEKIDIDLV
jgi:hypothetical protein